MTLQAYHLLLTAATIARKQEERFSRKEIDQKIKEIKYLSAQKKVPKLTLRKEIYLLEQKMKQIGSLDEELQKVQRRSAAKVAALKKENQALRQRLALSGQRDIGLKVDRLSHLLGETLAQEEVKKEAAEIVPVSAPAPISPLLPAKADESSSRAQSLRQRLELLRQELQITKQMKQLSKEKVAQLEGSMGLVEAKLAEYDKGYAIGSQKNLPFPEEQMEAHDFNAPVKHELLFESPTLGDLASESELPLPPPPKRRIG